jgi:hypothetical protein
VRWLGALDNEIAMSLNDMLAYRTLSGSPSKLSLVVIAEHPASFNTTQHYTFWQARYDWHFRLCSN